MAIVFWLRHAIYTRQAPKTCDLFDLQRLNLSPITRFMYIILLKSHEYE